MELICISLAGYLIGAVPFAYVIGKAFYHTDVRRHGSGNLGGSNTGRVLGKKAGLAVMTLDLLKVTLVVFLATKFCADPRAVAWGAVAAAIGHCYPVFVRFRGGKAVAAMYGFLFGLWLCAGYSPMLYFLPLVTFLSVLFLTKIVALSSMLSAVAAVVYLRLTPAEPSVRVAIVIFAALVILRHKDNIRRMLTGTENKIHWM